MYVLLIIEMSAPQPPGASYAVRSLTVRQQLDAETICTLEFRKEYVNLTAHEATGPLGAHV